VSAPDAVEPFARTFNGTYATTSYALNGMLLRPEARIADITDGTSNTLLGTTRYQVCGEVKNFWGLGAFSASTPSFALAPPEGDKYPRTTGKGSELKQFVPPAKGVQNPVKGRCGADEVEFATVAKAADTESGFQVAPQNNCDPRIPQTAHPGGLLIVLADGSARTVQGNINVVTFWSAVTPAGGEVLGDW